MNWKVKAFIQNFVSVFPSGLSYEMYFQMQRHFGNLKKPHNPMSHFSGAVSLLKKIRQYGYETRGKIFFEAGTGRVPLFPVAFWLGGAGKTITVDLNPYMRKELILDMLFYIRTKTEEIKTVFGDFLEKERLGMLLEYSRSKNINRNDFLALCQIEYTAPGDAAKSGLRENSIDYHISNAVYEHIPLNIIYNILMEGNRIITGDGLFINSIDYADHFAQMDKNISAVNFLQYNDKEWERYAGNRYMYMNRARHDEFIKLFESAGHEFLEIEEHKDTRACELLETGGIKLDKKFKEKGKEILSITGARFITKINGSRKNGT